MMMKRRFKFIRLFVVVSLDCIHETNNARTILLFYRDSFFFLSAAIAAARISNLR